MKASELIMQLAGLIGEHGDKEVMVDDGMFLEAVREVDLGSEEDDAIVIWSKV